VIPDTGNLRRCDLSRERISSSIQSVQTVFHVVLFFLYWVPVRVVSAANTYIAKSKYMVHSFILYHITEILQYFIPGLNIIVASPFT
jgi:hypothetical protein